MIPHPELYLWENRYTRISKLWHSSALKGRKARGEKRKKGIIKTPYQRGKHRNSMELNEGDVFVLNSERAFTLYCFFLDSGKMLLTEYFIVLHLHVN